MQIEYYSQRLLNPFRGIVNTIKYQSAEAVSTDGLVWDIYVSNDLLAQGMDSSSKIQTSDIRYGKWSVAHGLKRGPIFPSEDFKYLEHQGAIALEHVQQLHDKIPFPLSDNYELWLLDENSMPLALLDSTVYEDDIETERTIDWRAGNLCKRSFNSNAIADMSTDDNREGITADYLTGYINSLASNPPMAQWFKRNARGRSFGLAGINLPLSLAKRTLSDDAFPLFLLNHTAHDAPHRSLINDFLDWQAPWLLLLPTLDAATRLRFEQTARKQALIVEQQYKLYPEIIDEAVIKTARVEALLRKSQPSPEEEEEKVLSTFYLELNPSSAE